MVFIVVFRFVVVAVSASDDFHIVNFSERPDQMCSDYYLRFI